MLTQDELKRQLHYNPDTGEFIRISLAFRSNAKIGDIAGRFNHEYRMISVNHKEYLSHRLAFLYMTGKFPECEVDHINGIKHDNRWHNLRLASSSQNKFNRGIQKNNKSGFKGVSMHRGKWRAVINNNGKFKHIGLYDNPESASEAYKSAALILHDEFYYNAEQKLALCLESADYRKIRKQLGNECEVK